MAKVKFGSAVSEMRGSVGGVTYSRNAGGAYIRTRTTPVQPNSGRQSAVKSLFSSAVNAWTNVLTAGERTGWNNYAAAVPYTDTLGNVRYYSGQQRYIQCFVAAVNCGRATTTCAVAPISYTEGEPVAVADMSFEQGAAVANGTINMVNATAPASVAAGDTLLVLVGQPITAAKNYFKGPYRYAAAGVYATGGAYPDVMITDPYGRACAAGLRVPVQLRILTADNRLSPIVQFIATLATHSA